MPSRGNATPVFQGLRLGLPEGSVTDLTGPSGAGKSSLLMALARLNPCAKGRMTLMGRDASTFSPERWRALVSYLPQQPILLGTTVADAIRDPWSYSVRHIGNEAGWIVRMRRRLRFGRSVPDGPSNTMMRRALDGVGCSDIELDRPSRDLSGGQAARVCLCRTLLTRPRVLLCDEVDAGLDDANAAKVGEAIRAAANHGVAVLRVRHRSSDGLACRILTLKDGVLR
ncbi:ATP-binding cassette domain-containing protein [uncultured Bifidobacterium sp.]|uniref:ABC transporter ATP-binding protein n=1 Tax=uncultured Bifidobacterium sp. TaxID=165187 RepID=UPI002620D063|nr:ATP-binding cassette domain-containing protein [uncultured Bifidobacterium sp.]